MIEGWESVQVPRRLFRRAETERSEKGWSTRPGIPASESGFELAEPSDDGERSVIKTWPEILNSKKD
ncbi:hypothetical protein GCM10009612_73690 [Streptomyces beijiangensis]